ncbi:MAG TPA: pyridoxamine 5'-phosphate oxidase family protein [Acidobacteriaceae bacterium]|nr:pyridoxamine 5'-phosphate oxidase family protein [Acidobacteriaceae bacterium]
MQSYGAVMFGEASKRLQERAGSRAQYERLAAMGSRTDGLSASEAEFIAERDSFYLGSVTADGWPYIQHRGGPKGFLIALDAKTLAFADFAGNKQYISAGNFETNDRVSLFLMSYPEQARLKVIGHAHVVDAGADAALEARVAVPGYRAKVERVVVIDLVAFDWNCSQHIERRWSAGELATHRTPIV